MVNEVDFDKADSYGVRKHLENYKKEESNVRIKYYKARNVEKPEVEELPKHTRQSTSTTILFSIGFSGRKINKVLFPCS